MHQVTAKHQSHSSLCFSFFKSGTSRHGGPEGHNLVQVRDLLPWKARDLHDLVQGGASRSDVQPSITMSGCFMTRHSLVTSPQHDVTQVK